MDSIISSRYLTSTFIPDLTLTPRTATTNTKLPPTTSSPLPSSSSSSSSPLKHRSTILSKQIVRPFPVVVIVLTSLLLLVLDSVVLHSHSFVLIQSTTTTSNSRIKAGSKYTGGGTKIMEDDIRTIRRERWLLQNTNSRTNNEPNANDDDGATATATATTAVLKEQHTANSSSSSATTSRKMGDEEEKEPISKVMLTNNDGIYYDGAFGGKQHSSTSSIGTTATQVNRRRTNGTIRGRKHQQKQIKPSSSSSSSLCIDLTSDGDGDSNSDNDDDAGDDAVIITKSTRQTTQTTKTAAPKKGVSQIRKDNKQTTNKNGDNNRIIPTFAISTYNVWFGPPHPAARMSQIASILSSLSSRPVLVGLQEVTPMLQEELFPLLMSLGYHVITQDDASEDDTGGDSAYYCAIAVLIESVSTNGGPTAQIIDSGFRPYSQSVMGRGLLWVHAWIGGSTTDTDRMTTHNNDTTDNNGTYVLFTTTHLESFMRNYPRQGQTYDGVSQRAAQVVEATQFCSKYMSSWGGDGRLEAAFLTGDLNWDDERKRAKGADRPLLDVIEQSYGGEGGSNNNGTTKWEDVWLNMCPGQEGYTYDSKLNPMLRGNLRRRFDRCLVNIPSKRNNVTDGNDCGGVNANTLATHAVQMIGTDPIEGLEWKKEIQKWAGGGPMIGSGTYMHLPVLASDHYGLYAVLGDFRLAPPSTKGTVEKKGKTGRGSASTSKRRRLK